MRLPKKELTRAHCPQCDTALVAFNDSTMEAKEVAGEPNAPFNPGYMEVFPLGWRDDQASLVLEVVMNVQGYTRDVRHYYDILCPNHGIIEWEALQKQVEEEMHANYDQIGM